MVKLRDKFRHYRPIKSVRRLSIGYLVLFYLLLVVIRVTVNE